METSSFIGDAGFTGDIQAQIRQAYREADHIAINHDWEGHQTSPQTALPLFGKLFDRLWGNKYFKKKSNDKLSDEDFGRKNRTGTLNYQHPSLELTFEDGTEKVEIYKPEILLHPEIYVPLLTGRAFGDVQGIMFRSPYKSLSFSVELKDHNYQLRLQIPDSAEQMFRAEMRQDLASIVVATTSTHRD